MRVKLVGARAKREEFCPGFCRGLHGEWRFLCMFSITAALGGALVAPVVWRPTRSLASQQGGYAESAFITRIMRVKAIPRNGFVDRAGADRAGAQPAIWQGRNVRLTTKPSEYAFAVSLLGSCPPPALRNSAAPWWTFAPFGNEFHVGADGRGRMANDLLGVLGVFYPFGSILTDVEQDVDGFSYNVCLPGPSWCVAWPGFRTTAPWAWHERQRAPT